MTLCASARCHTSILYQGFSGNGILTLSHRWSAGCSRPLAGESTRVFAQSPTGTIPYTAPETLELDHVTKQTDVYAFGILRMFQTSSTPDINTLSIYDRNQMLRLAIS